MKFFQPPEPIERTALPYLDALAARLPGSLFSPTERARLLAREWTEDQWRLMSAILRRVSRIAAEVEEADLPEVDILVQRLPDTIERLEDIAARLVLIKAQTKTNPGWKGN